MSRRTFPISNNTTGYCYSPFTCTSEYGTCIVWAECNDLNDDFCIKFMRYDATNDQELQSVVISTFPASHEMLFFNKFSKNWYALGVMDNNSGNTCVYLIDSDGKIQAIHIFNVANEELVYCCEYANETYLFTHNYSEQSWSLFKTSGAWSKLLTIQTFFNAHSMPKIHQSGDNFTAGWLNEDNELRVTHSKLNVVGDQECRVIINCQVEYLCSAQIDTDLFVFGGCGGGGEILRLDFFRTVDNSINLIKTLYWKCDQYVGKEIRLCGLHKGFMLIANDSEHVYIQRFSHLGAWLYPLHKISNDIMWAPALSGNQYTVLLTSIKELNGHNELWATEFHVNPFTEISNLKLEDVTTA